MITLLLAAGEGRRFREAGYAAPKPVLPLHGEPLAVRVIRSIPANNLIIVAQRRDQKAVHTAILAATLFRAVPRVLWLDSVTTGPLATAYLTRKWLKSKDELLISYCDCWLENDEVTQFIAAMRLAGEKGKQAGAVVFESHDERFSRTPDGRHATGGLFYFRRADEFLHHARRLRAGPLGIPAVVWSYSEMDVPLYAVYRAQNYRDVGTPGDYEKWLVTTSSSPRASSTSAPLTPQTTN